MGRKGKDTDHSHSKHLIQKGEAVFDSGYNDYFQVDRKLLRRSIDQPAMKSFVYGHCTRS